MRRDIWLAGLAGVVLGSWLTLIVVQLQEHGFGVPNRASSQAVAENQQTVAAPPPRETAKAEVTPQPVQAQPEAAKHDTGPATATASGDDITVQPAAIIVPQTAPETTAAVATTTPSILATAPNVGADAPAKVAPETVASADNSKASPATNTPTTSPASAAESTPVATPASTSGDTAKAAIATGSDQNKKDNAIAASQPKKEPPTKSPAEVAQLRVTPSSKNEMQAAQANAAKTANGARTEAAAKTAPGKTAPKQEPPKQIASVENSTGQISPNPASTNQASAGQASVSSTAPASSTLASSTPASSGPTPTAQAQPDQMPADQMDRELDASAHRTVPAEAPTEQASLGGEQKPLDAAKSVELVRPFADRAGILTIAGKSVQLPGIIPTDADRTCIGPNGKEWPCGTMARTAFRMYLRGRTIDCDLPSPTWSGTITGACRYARIDLSEWLVRFGWALPEAGSPLAALADEAREQKRGLYGDDPRRDGKSTLAPPPAKEDPLNPI